MSGVRALPARYQLELLVQRTKKRGAGCVQCPVLVLQTRDDTVCDPSNAEHLFKLLHVPDKSLRYYPEGGHDVLCSRTVLAVCSDVFQFCSRIRGLEVDPIKQEEQLLKKSHSESTEWLFYRSSRVISVLMRINSSMARVMCFFLRQ